MKDADMSHKASEAEPQSQSDKFKDVARELGCDEDEKAWEDRLRKIAKAKPAEGTPQE